MDTDDNFMSLGYMLVPVHAMRAISLGHIDIFKFYLKKTVIIKASTLGLVIFSCTQDIYKSLFIPCVPCPWDIQMP